MAGLKAKLLSLLIFFVASVLIYSMYVYVFERIRLRSKNMEIPFGSMFVMLKNELKTYFFILGFYLHTIVVYDVGNFIVMFL